MKKNLLIKSMFLLFALIVGSGTMWADETVFYTLDGTVSGNNSSYAGAADLTQNGISWSVTANTQTNP